MRVFVTSYLAELIGRTELVFDVPREMTLADFFGEILFAEYPALMPRILDETGQIRPHVAVFVRDSRVGSLDDPLIVLGPACDVSIFPALSGG